MTIGALSQDDFGALLDATVSAARPIRSVQMLKGRDEQLEDIRRALYLSGRQIFIFGERGVGKSSLAATAAYQYQSSDAEPIFVGGSPDETFFTIIATIAAKALDRSRSEVTKTTKSRSMEYRGFKWSSSAEVSALDLASQIKSVGDAADLLKQVAAKHSQKPCIVLDEFDAIPDTGQRGRFAALLKQLGDQSVDLKFFITGVGSSCQELLGAHESAHRQLATFELDRLGFNGRREIVDEAADAFGLNADSDVNWRIALISDGFPYYIHLIVEKMLWEAYIDEREITTLSWPQFRAGLRVAIRDTNAQLRKPYELAVLQRSPEYEDVVWSTADGDDLLRPLSSMRLSYQRVIEKRTGRPVLDSDKYAASIRTLRQPAMGVILEPVAGRSGWYTYREKMLRGYVRMQAEAAGVELSGEPPASKQVMHVANSRTGYRGSSSPPGVRENRRIERETDQGGDAGPTGAAGRKRGDRT